MDETMSGFENVADPVSPPAPGSGNTDWSGVADPVAIPKMPDTSAAQTSAQNNLAANDNAGSTPMQRLNTAAGFPVDKVINGTAQPADFNTDHRQQYVDAVNDGSATNSSDWMQSLVHSVAPIAAGGVQRALHPIQFAEEAAADVGQALRGGEEWLKMLPMSPEEREATVNAQLTPYANPNAPTGPELETRALEYEHATFGKLIGGMFAPLAALSPIVSPVINQTGGTPLKPGQPRTYQSNNPLLLNTIMDFAGLWGLHAGAEGIRPAGTWDNLPGHEIIKPEIGNQLGKEPHAVTSQDTDNVFAAGAKDIHPPAKDFANVSTVTGIPEPALKDVYVKTGATPEKVFTDSRVNPQVAADVAAGRVPAQYEHLVEPPKPVLSNYQSAYHFDTDSYGIKDEHGNFVKTGFESPEEARAAIEQEKGLPVEEKPEATEQNQYERPSHLEKTSTAEQAIISGAEKATEARMAQRGTEAPLKPEVMQKPADDGLFDVAARKQQDLFSRPTIVRPSEIGKPTSLRTFLSNNGAKFNEDNELVSIKQNGTKINGDAALEYAHEITKEQGYLPKDEANRLAQPLTDLQNALTENGGREHFRDQDQDRVQKFKEAAEARKRLDPAYIEHEAHNAGIDTEKLAGETDKQHIERLVKAVKNYYSSLNEPVVEAVKNIWGDESGAVPSDVLKEVRDAVAPTMAGEKAQRAAIVLRNAYGLARRSRAIDETSLSKVAKIAAKLDDAGRADFYNYVQGRSVGATLKDEALRPMADSIRAVYQRMRGELEAMPETRTMNFVQDYFTQNWKNEDAARRFVNDFIEKQGSERSLKKKAIPTIADGMAAGLELKEENPVRAVSAYLGSMTNYIASVNGLRSIVHDLGAEYFAKGEQPNDWQPLVGKNAQRIQNARIDTESGRMIPARNMQLYAPPEVARIYNRFYSKGFEDTGLKSTYELARDAINTNTLFELGLSTYHLGTINIQSINQDIGRILKNSVAGDWRGVVDAAKKLVTPGLHYMEGRKMVQQYTALKDHGIDMEQMANHFAMANLRIGLDPLRTISKRGFVEGAMRGELPEIIDHLKQQAMSGYGTGLVKSGAEVLARGVNDISAPIFQHYVPAIKMSSFSDLMSDWLRQNPAASDAEIAATQARIGNLVDDRFGEMNMENVFWPKIMKEMAGLEFRAPGWDLGLIRQVGGAGKDFYSMLENAVTGKGFNPNLLDRQLYMVAAVATYAAWNSALTYLHTGVSPSEQELRDFIAYRTGGMRKQFNKWFPERGVLPGHGREIVNTYPLPGQGALSGVAEEVSAKTTTLPRNIYQALINRDWRNKPIYDPKSKSWIQRTPVVAQAAHIIEGFKPFMLDNMEGNGKEEGTNISPLARALGVRPAGTRITDRKDLQKLLDKENR